MKRLVLMPLAFSLVLAPKKDCTLMFLPCIHCEKSEIIAVCRSDISYEKKSCPVFHWNAKNLDSLDCTGEGCPKKQFHASEWMDYPGCWKIALNQTVKPDILLYGNFSTKYRSALRLIKKLIENMEWPNQGLITNYPSPGARSEENALKGFAIIMIIVVFMLIVGIPIAARKSSLCKKWFKKYVLGEKDYTGKDPYVEIPQIGGKDPYVEIPQIGGKDPYVEIPQIGDPEDAGASSGDQTLNEFDVSRRPNSNNRIAQETQPNQSSTEPSQEVAQSVMQSSFVREVRFAQQDSLTKVTVGSEGNGTLQLYLLAGDRCQVLAGSLLSGSKEFDLKTPFPTTQDGELSILIGAYEELFKNRTFNVELERTSDPGVPFTIKNINESSVAVQYDDVPQENLLGFRLF